MRPARRVISNRPASTGGPSLGNFVQNVKSLPGDFARIGKTIGSGIKKVADFDIRKGIKASGGGTKGRGAINRAILNRSSK